jgi:DNA gyrase subunit A
MSDTPTPPPPPSDPIAAFKLPSNIADEMRQSYMDYAMSVIIGRALPDVRDGLKPANRRVLFGMSEMGLQPGRPYKKSARVAGDVMGKYHPHGEGAIYDTLVRMAQPWNMRVPLVDGQGNFGSVDGDPAAAMRYTECRLTRMGAAMMTDLDKETVDFAPTYDNESSEPVVMPTAFPNLLVNGAEGIAVGMATKIPPHNLGEVVEAILFLIESPDLTPDERLEGVMERVPGPDFPTAGLICGRAGIRQAYREGRGGVELARDKKIDGIADVRDESDRQGMRIVIDIRKGESSQVILNNLYKHTPMQETFGIIMLAIVDQRPRILNLLQACELFLDFRRDVVRRRTAYELRKAEARAHILEGYVIALDHLDQVIALIRGAKTPADAKAGLITQFGMSEIQADEVLKLQLQRLTGLERQKIVDELTEIRILIADLRDILAKPKRVDEIVAAELKKIRDEQGDPRRTEIQDAVEDLSVEDLIAEEDVVISITHTGYIKRTSISTYRSQKRGGRGRMGMRTKDEDFVDQLFIASTHSYILIFTDRGRVYWLKVHEIPEVGPQGRGKAVVNLVHLTPQEKIAAFVSVKSFDAGRYVLLATRKGIVKKTEISNFANPRTAGIIALGVEDDDALIEAVLTAGKDEVLLGTKEGMAIHFAEEDVRPMGRAAYGVKGIELEKTDDVVGVEVVSAGGTVLTLTSNGYGKRTTIDEYRLQSRGGKGIIDIKTTERNGPVVGVKFLRGDEQVMLITEKGMIIRLNTAEISTIGRNTQGVRLIQLEEGDHLVSVARLAEREEGDEGGPPRSDAPPEGKEEA